MFEKMFKLKSLSKETKEVVVGLSSLLVIIFILLGFYNKGSSINNLKSDHYFVLAHFNKTDGIIAGDIVRMAGIPVGRVSEITLDDHFAVNLKIILAKNIKLPEDSSAAIHTSGFFGKKYIEIVPGGSYENIPEGGVILYTQDTILIEDLLNRIISIGRNLRGLSEENEMENYHES